MSRLDHGRPVLRLIDDAHQLDAITRAASRQIPGPGIAGPPPPRPPRHGSAELHAQALAALRHVLKHKDVRQVRRLVETVPGLQVKAALSMWFCAHGPLRLCESTGLILYEKQAKARLHEAMIKPYWTHLLA